MKLALNDKTLTVGINVYRTQVNNLCFPDDIDIVAKSNQDLQDTTTAVHETSKKLGLKINAEKTKVMAIRKDDL